MIGEQTKILLFEFYNENKTNVNNYVLLTIISFLIDTFGLQKQI